MKSRPKIPAFSINKLSEITGLDRRTVKKRLHGQAPAEITSKGDGLFTVDNVMAPSHQLTQGDSGMSAAEAQRLLLIARKDEIALNMEVLRKERPRLVDITEINEEALGNVAGLLKAHKDKVLSEELINDIFAELRGIGAKLVQLFK